VANEGARINVPDDGDVVARKVKLGGLGGAPVGGEQGELADDEGFDVGPGGLFVVEV